MCNRHVIVVWYATHHVPLLVWLPIMVMRLMIPDIKGEIVVQCIFDTH